MSKHTRSAAVFALVALSLVATGCKKKKDFETNVKLTRLQVVKRDEKGSPLTMDVEVTYVDCPGTQIEILRSGPEFASCMQKYKLDDQVGVRIKRVKDPEGFWDWDVLQVGDCTRVPDPHDEASYKMVRECSDWQVNKVSVGFECDYSDQKVLKKKCPWFSKH